MAGENKWVPLESNPEVITKFAHKLGLPANWSFVDVVGLDPELLGMVPSPVAAVLLLFPISGNYENFVKQRSHEIESDGQAVSDKVFFMKQTIKNACGAMALLHALANSMDQVKFGDDGLLNKFLAATKAMNPDERGTYLEQCKEIAQVHEEYARQGQTQAPSANENVDLHFVCLANVDGHIYDLDGRKPFPFNCGATTGDSFLKDASKVCKDYMARDPENLNFSVVALAKIDG
uniref:Ubiquitin carboxyl-terminal hydrolase n=1 Tax=Amblyomma triste TaxID=251400 RepID=A0A023GC21_AMBTT